jgi:hypothetical protein
LVDPWATKERHSGKAHMNHPWVFHGDGLSSVLVGDMRHGAGWWRSIQGFLVKNEIVSL